MNERIKELAKQAGIITNLDTDYSEKDMNKWVDYFSEKFAELIIQEYTLCCERVVGTNKSKFVKELYEAAHVDKIETCDYNGMPSVVKEFDPQLFFNLAMQKLWDSVAQEKIDGPDDDYSDGYNAAITDVLYVVSHFGDDEEK